MVAERTWKAAGLIGVLALGLWLVDSMMSRAEMWPWLAGLYGVIEWAWSVAKTVGPVVAVAAPAGWLVATAYEGRDKSPGAGFLVRPE
jgi:S-DNA-T family DNA segregation ATPase FtsK/SpoIIIE